MVDDGSKRGQGTGAGLWHNRQRHCIPDITAMLWCGEETLTFGSKKKGISVFSSMVEVFNRPQMP